MNPEKNCSAALIKPHHLAATVEALRSNRMDLIAYVDENHQNHLLDVAKPTRDYLILIGPEGDFDPEEISQKYEAILK